MNQSRHRAAGARDEQPPLVVRPAIVGNMLIAISQLSGIVVGFCVLSGLVFGGYRLLSKRFGDPSAQGAMISLHLSDK